MNKTIRLSTTGIEYGDYTWNFASGCGNQVNGKCKSGGFKCWAYSISQRFECNYPNGFTPTIYPEAFLSPLYLKKPSRILCVFMGDLFTDCPEFDPDKKFHSLMPSGKASVTMSLKGWIFTTIRQCPQHKFLFLTKQPQNLHKWSPFPDNCWVGVTATNSWMFSNAVYWLSQIEAKVKYLSLEPLQERILPHYIGGFGDVQWIIIGSQTKPYRPPQLELVSDIIDICVDAGIPYFLKNNLNRVIPKVFGGDGELIQEMPK